MKKTFRSIGITRSVYEQKRACFIDTILTALINAHNTSLRLEHDTRIKI